MAKLLKKRDSKRCHYLGYLIVRRNGAWSVQRNGVGLRAGFRSKKLAQEYVWRRIMRLD